MQPTRARNPAPTSEAAPREDEHALESAEFCTAGHAELFAESDEARCDACGAPVGPEDEEGFALRGEGEYVWTRGDEVRREVVPLCPTCATAVFGAAIAKWEIEEEEG